MAGFNSRFHDYIFTSANVISMLYEMELIIIEEGNVKVTKVDQIDDLLNQKSKLSLEWQKLANGSLTLSKILKENTISLYSKLQIQL